MKSIRSLRRCLIATWVVIGAQSFAFVMHALDVGWPR